MSQDNNSILDVLNDPIVVESQVAAPIAGKPIVLNLAEVAQDRFILIKRTFQSRIPAEIMEESYQGIGGSLNEETKDVLRGLSFAEEAVILPNLLGIPAESQQFIAATKLYWCNIEVTVPHKGLRLNITTTPTPVVINGTTQLIDIPKIPEDYVRYRFALAHNQVALNKVLAEGYETPYYIEDAELEEKLEMDKLQEVYKARKSVEKFIDLSKPLTDASQNFTAIQAICKLSKDIHAMPIPIDRKGLVKLVDTLCTLYPGEVTSLATDKNLQDRLFVDMLIDTNIIKMIGSEIYDEKISKDPVAIGIDSYILFINTQTNRAIKARLSTELKAKTATKH